MPYWYVEIAKELAKITVIAGQTSDFRGRGRFASLRPILMTSIAFISGLVTYGVSQVRAGAEMRHAMGVAVFSGMIGVTLFGLSPYSIILLCIG